MGNNGDHCVSLSKTGKIESLAGPFYGAGGAKGGVAAPNGVRRLDVFLFFSARAHRTPKIPTYLANMLRLGRIGKISGISAKILWSKKRANLAVFSLFCPRKRIVCHHSIRKSRRNPLPTGEFRRKNGKQGATF